MRRAGVFVVVILLVTVAPGSVLGEQDTSGPDSSDPETDVIGWEDGYWHNDSIDVDQSDGLTDRELEAYVARSMARVEFLRGKEFQRRVTVSPFSRDRYRSLVRSQARVEYTPASRAWENQVWEALFVAGGRTDAVREQVRLRQERIAGFYIPGTDRLYVVSDGELVVDNATLIHELTHALQDQHGGLGSSQSNAETMDERRGQSGLTEGEAMYVEHRYVERCGEEWECVETPGPAPPRAPYSEGRLPDYNLGMQVSLIQPYSDGPAYVAARLDDGGWSAVDAEYADPPESSEQVIHPQWRNQSPEDLRLGEGPTNGWRLFGRQGENGSETVGEAGIYTMFWYQGRAHDNPVIPWREFDTGNAGALDRFDYTSEPSVGWANDRLFPVRKGDERGYVWRTRWDTSRDATEFERAYRELLAGRNATQVGPRTWAIRDGGFAGAYHVERDGRTVTVVNGPTVGDLRDIRPGIEVQTERDDGRRSGRVALRP